VQFYAGDKGGNVEDTQTIEFQIDKTSPEAEIGYGLSKFDSTVTGKDTSGGTTVTVEKSSLLHAKYTIFDQAGNTLILHVDKIKVGKQVTLNLKTLQYNNDAVIQLDKNIYTTLVLTDRNNKIKQLDQFYALKDDKKIFTSYSNKRSITKIYTKNLGNKYIREDKKGIVLLQLYTENKVLKYSY